MSVLYCSLGRSRHLCRLLQKIGTLLVRRISRDAQNAGKFFKSMTCHVDRYRRPVLPTAVSHSQHMRSTVQDRSRDVLELSVISDACILSKCSTRILTKCITTILLKCVRILLQSIARQFFQNISQHFFQNTVLDFLQNIVSEFLKIVVREFLHHFAPVPSKI